MPITDEQQEKLKYWFAIASQLKQLREEESKLRGELVSTLFNAEKDSGTESLDLGNGFKLKVTKSLDYKLNNKEGQVEAVIALIGDEIAKKLVHWSPDLSVTAYKNLDAETQKLFNGCLTIKPAKSTLEVVAPKV